MTSFVRERKELLTPAQAAVVLKRPKSTIYHLIRTGRLSSWREEGTRSLFVEKKQVDDMAGDKVRLVKVESPPHRSK